MTLNTFINQVLAMKLSMNEIAIILELGHADFSRDDILGSIRCPGAYSPSALTRTLQKLKLKNPAIISTYTNLQNKTTYRLIDRPDPYGEYEDIILAITRSRVLTVNTMRVALQMILNKNRVSTTRFLAYQLNVEPDYLAATVLPRMIVVGLLKADKIELNGCEDLNYVEQDKLPIHGVHLDLQWKGASEIMLL